MRTHAAYFRLLAAALVAPLTVAVTGTASLGQSAPAPGPSAPSVSLSLHDAMTMALANNLTYKAAAADVGSAEGQLIQARGSSYPSVSAGYSYVHTQDPAFFLVPIAQPSGPPVFQKAFFSATNINNVNATLQYAIYTGGAVQAAIGAAAAGFSASESNYAAVRADVLDSTTTAYYALVLTRQTATITDQAVDVGKQNLSTSQQLYEAGSAAKADVLKQQVTLANAQVATIRAHNASDLANARLANVLDINLNSYINPTEPLGITPPVYSLPELLQDAQTRRPEVAAAIDAVTIAEKAVQEARAGTLPAIGLEISEASSKPNFVNVPQPQLSETLFAVWRFFDGGLTHGKVVQAQSAVDKAKINLHQLRNQVDLQVRDAYFNYQAAQAAVTAADSARTSAAESLRVTQLRYRAGVGTSLELSDALLAYTQTQVQYASALADQSTTLVSLQRAAGLL